MINENGAFDGNATVTNWKRSLGNGKAALVEAADAITAVVSSGDNTVLSRMMDAAEDKGDVMASRTVAFLVREVFPGAKIANVAVKDKDGKATEKTRVSIKTKGIAARNEPVVTLAECVEKGLSLRGPTLRMAFKSDDNKPKWKLMAKADRFVADCHKHKQSIAAQLAALQAAEDRYQAKKLAS